MPQAQTPTTYSDWKSALLASLKYGLILYLGFTLFDCLRLIWEWMGAKGWQFDVVEYWENLFRTLIFTTGFLLSRVNWRGKKSGIDSQFSIPPKAGAKE